MVHCMIAVPAPSQPPIAKKPKRRYLLRSQMYGLAYTGKDVEEEPDYQATVGSKVITYSV